MDHMLFADFIKSVLLRKNLEFIIYVNQTEI